MSSAIETIEVHPWVSFPQNPQDATKLIVGSFPPKRFSEKKLEGEDVDFFYGSRDNSFLPDFAESIGFAYNHPADIEAFKAHMEASRWVITDIVLETKRNPKKPDSAADTDLRPVSWSKGVIERIFRENSIKHVFFTSNWVRKNFYKHIIEESSPVLSDCEVCTLVSPSPQGLMSMNWAFERLPIENEESRSDYRKRYYKTFFQDTLLRDKDYRYTIKSNEGFLGTFSFDELKKVKFFNDDLVLRSDAVDWRPVVDYMELHSIMDINPPPPPHYWNE